MVGLALEIEPGIDGLCVQLAGEEKTAVVLPSDPVTQGAGRSGSATVGSVVICQSAPSVSR
jgi:hypothetical protein